MASRQEFSKDSGFGHNEGISIEDPSEPPQYHIAAMCRGCEGALGKALKPRGTSLFRFCTMFIAAIDYLNYYLI